RERKKRACLCVVVGGLSPWTERASWRRKDKTAATGNRQADRYWNGNSKTKSTKEVVVVHGTGRVWRSIRRQDR
ncbi:hypothetical protein K456DRAFT_56518, partial [Colletotrichum gloeosporioides 23]